jgi:hypothetical protein
VASCTWASTANSARREIEAGVGVRDRAADGAHIAHRRSGDLGGGMGQHRSRSVKDPVGGYGAVPGRSADHDAAVSRAPDSGKLRDPGETDKRCRLDESGIHHRDERSAAGNRPGVGRTCEDVECFIQGTGAKQGRAGRHACDPDASLTVIQFN